MTKNFKKLLLLGSFTLLFPANIYASDSIRISNQQGMIPDEFNRKFNEFVNNFFDNKPEANFADKKFIPFRSSFSFPKADVYETEKIIEYTIEIPGIKKEDVNLQISNGLISISYKVSGESSQDTKNYLLRERNISSFERQFSVPNYADADKASAEYKDGLLKISIPISENSKIKPKKIEIK